MQEKPVVTIVHSLPGRVRFRLSHAPTNPNLFEETVKNHPGIYTVKYTTHTKSVLVKFDTNEITQEELVIRISMLLSIENDNVPVKVYVEPEVENLSDSAFYSGIALLVALVLKVVKKDFPNSVIINWFAGLTTTYAVLDHGYSEVKEEGNFHPEVLSLVYLLISFTRGNFLSAAIFTWTTTFGRHLLRPPTSAIEIKPIQISENKNKEPSYEVSITPVRAETDKMAMFSLIPAVLKYAVTGDASAMQGNLLENIRGVSQSHGEVLDGLSEIKKGIPIRIK
jgi:hypothetical protein